VSSGEYDVVIVGAGIVGAACAAEAARAGFRVAVLESSIVGGGATACGMGHIVVMDDSEAQFALNGYSQILWDELAERLPASCEFHRCGTIWVAANDEEMEAVHRKHAFYRDRGVDTEILDAPALTRLEPNLRPGLTGGLRVPGDSVVYPPCAARFLLEEALTQGATLGQGVGVRELTGAEVQLEDGTALAARFTVNAAGEWATRLTPGLPLRGRKGHLAITDRYPGFLRHQVIELGYLSSAHGSDADSVASNVQPRPTGQLLIGSSREFDAPDDAVDAAMLGRMLRRSLSYIPALRDLSVLRAWTGFRAATPDHLPLIGPHPAVSGLLLATGHEGLGITTSLATAKLIVAHMTGATPAIPAEPYVPSRLLPARPETND
jgi:glycine/D-amino acid oxidase-like deaminating enzyme